MVAFAIEEREPAALLAHPANFRRHPEPQRAALAASLEEHGWLAAPIWNQRTGHLLDGHARVEWARDTGAASLPVRVVDVSERQEKRILASFDQIGALALTDDRALSALLAELEADGGLPAGWTPTDLEALLDQMGQGGGEPEMGKPVDQEAARATLAERFGVPPFSVLDARQGYWQERKRAWLAMGIESELGRDGATIAGSPNDRRPGRAGGDYERGHAWLSTGGSPSGTSIFDPVLCELAYRWFCPERGRVLDPFAGGSVRGIVAGCLGRSYVGIDLSEGQIAANRLQAERIGVVPDWIVGDSRECVPQVGGEFDFVFSCPPYADLEVYSDDPRDLSTLAYPAFLAAYRQIVAAAVARLKENRFACFVVGDVRDPQGFYRCFVADTVAAFQDAGMRLYNDAVLVTAVGSLPIRMAKPFGSYRKLGKTHQSVLVFYRGDPKRIPEIAADCQFGDVGEGSADDSAPV